MNNIQHLKKVFDTLANKHTKGKLPGKYCGNYVPNEIVAVFEAKRQFERTTKWVINNFNADERNNAIDEEANLTFVIVLESPHIKEFAKNRGDNNGDHPAVGPTGKNIRDYFIDYINKFVPSVRSNNHSKTNLANGDIRDGKYKLILVNLINFQCSLGVSTKKYIYIDKMLKKIIDYKEKGVAIFCEHFKDEISKYKPDVILNACTKDFKSTVWTLIDSLNLRAVELESEHPANWYNDFKCIYNRIKTATTPIEIKRNKKLIKTNKKQ